MDLASKFEHNNPWPARNGEKILFLLDARNSFEQDILQQWIHHHTASGSDEFRAPQVSVDLGDDRGGIDSAQLVMSLALPDDTLVVPLRVAWQPPAEAINSGPRVRDLVFGDPRHPNARRARKILEQSPERMHLVAGLPDTVSNLRQRFEQHHNIEEGETQQREFAQFVARQAAVVLDLAERKLLGGRYKVPRLVAASLLASQEYNQAVEKLVRETGYQVHALRGLLKDLARPPGIGVARVAEYQIPYPRARIDGLGRGLPCHPQGNHQRIVRQGQGHDQLGAVDAAAVVPQVY